MKNKLLIFGSVLGIIFGAFQIFDSASKLKELKKQDNKEESEES